MKLIPQPPFQGIAGPLPVWLRKGKIVVKASDIADQFQFEPKFRRRYRRLMKSDFVPHMKLIEFLMSANPRRIPPVVREQLKSWRREAYRALAAVPLPDLPGIPRDLVGTINAAVRGRLN